MSNIEIGNTKPRIKYEADGTQKSFDFFFPIFATDDIVVYFKDQKQNRNFEVSYSEENKVGSIIFNIAPISGTIITITRELLIQRTTNFSESKSFRAKTLNHEFDYQVACLEDLSDKISRSISVPVYSNVSANLDFPNPEAGKSLTWDSEAGKLVNSKINVDDLIENIEFINNNIETVNNIPKSVLNNILVGLDNEEGYSLKTPEEVRNILGVSAGSDKANIDLSNVSSENIRALAGTRYAEFEIETLTITTTFTVYHGLDLNPTYARSDTQLICKTANGGYSPGDIITAWSPSGDSGGRLSVADHPTVDSSTIKLRTGNHGIQIINNTNGTYDNAPLAYFKLKFRLWY